MKSGEPACEVERTYKMIPPLNTLQPLRPSLASGLKNAAEVYDHITPPNEEDDSDCTRFISRCLVDIKEEQRRQHERLQMIEHYDGDTPSSKSDKIYAIWEEIGDLKSNVENIEDKIQDIEDRLTSMEEKNEEQFDTLQEEIGDLESKVDSLETKVDSLDTKVDSLDTKVDSLDTKFEAKIDSLEAKFDKVMFDQEIWASRQRNSLASRFYQPVQLVGISYVNADGKIVLKMPTWPIRSVGYYWKMHEKENHYNLIDAHRFFQIDFRHWALSDDKSSDDSHETDDLNLPAKTLEQAVSMYPDRAVMALFNELGLVYSRFHAQIGRQQFRPTTVLQKRSPKDSSSKLERRVRRPSDGSTTEVITSPTASASLS